MFIGVVTDTQWKKFCEVFDRPDLFADQRLQSNGGRVEQRSWLVDAVAENFKALTTAELLNKCEKAQLAFGPVNKPEDLLTDPHLNSNGQLKEMKLPDGKKVKTPRLPIEMNGRSFTVRQDPPSIGQHSRDTLAAAGLEATQIDELFAAGHILEVNHEH